MRYATSCQSNFSWGPDGSETELLFSYQRNMRRQPRKGKIAEYKKVRKFHRCTKDQKTDQKTDQTATVPENQEKQASARATIQTPINF